MKKKTQRSYNELNKLSTYDDRFKYLQTPEIIGSNKFGFNRYLNQKFYQSPEWKKVRNQVIIRDNGCDMGLEGFPIKGQIYIHHINPLTLDDIRSNSNKMLDLNNLICVSKQTHNAIHYGGDAILNDKKVIERAPFDMCPWKKSIEKR